MICKQKPPNWSFTRKNTNKKQIAPWKSCCWKTVNQKRLWQQMRPDGLFGRCCRALAAREGNRFWFRRWSYLRGFSANRQMPQGRFGLCVPVREILNDLQAHRLAFFRMELGCENVVTRCCRTKFVSVLRTQSDHFRIFRLNIIWMHKINIWLWSYIFE